MRKTLGERREKHVEMRTRGIDVCGFDAGHTLRNRLGRVLWGVVWLLLYRPSPRPAHVWRRFLLSLFGARIGRGAHPYPSARIWAPWNLTMGEHSCVAGDVNCYNAAPVRIGAHATVSQYTYLCTASHDIQDPYMRLVTAAIEVGDGAWIAADVFVGPGVIIGEGAVVGARSSVFRSVDPWTVVAGSPARFLRIREVRPS